MFIQPNWPASTRVHAFTSLRSGGVSSAPYDKFNLAQHVGDHAADVSTNRTLLKKMLELPNEPIWIQQTHSTIALKATLENTEKEADATYTDRPHQVCLVLTADCLPLLLCQRDGTKVAAIHAGWRGLLNGVIEKTIAALQISSQDCLAWLGPAISKKHYEVGAEVRECFLNHHPETATAFSPSHNPGRWMADLYALARQRLHSCGITAIHGGDYCTYSDPSRFYSYRRDGEKTGRMASLIWISDSPKQD